MSNGNEKVMSDALKKANQRMPQASKDTAIIASYPKGTGGLHTMGSPDDEYSAAVERSYARDNPSPQAGGSVEHREVTPALAKRQDEAGSRVTRKKETRQGRSIIDVTTIRRDPKESKLNLSGFYYEPGEEGHAAQKNHEFLASWESREVHNGPDYKAPVYHHGPDTDFRAEEINPQHYGRDYEPAPFKDMFKWPKAWEAGIRRQADDMYQDCETPGAVDGAYKSSLAYGTVSFEDIPTENTDNRTYSRQQKYARQEDEVDIEADEDD